jgi:hypothetical protein
MLAGWIIDSCASWTEADAPGAGQRQDRVRATDPGLTPGATDLAPACAGSVKQFLGGTGSRLPAPRPPGYRRISEEVEKPAGLEPARRVSVAPDPHRADLVAQVEIAQRGVLAPRSENFRASEKIGVRRVFLAELFVGVPVPPVALLRVAEVRCSCPHELRLRSRRALSSDRCASSLSTRVSGCVLARPQPRSGAARHLSR